MPLKLKQKPPKLTYFYGFFLFLMAIDRCKEFTEYKVYFENKVIFGGSAENNILFF
jgi:hypothetical protein